MYKMKKAGKNTGFTLIEVMIALAITAIVMTAMISVFTQNSKVFSMQTELSKSQNNARASLEALSRDIRMAGFTNLANSGDSFAQGEFSGGSGQIYLYPILGIKDGPNTIVGTDDFGSMAANEAIYIKGQYGDVADAIEIWGCFSRKSVALDANPKIEENSTRLEVAENGNKYFLPGDTVLGPDYSVPGWLLVGQIGKACFQEVDSSSSATGNSIPLLDLLCDEFDDPSMPAKNTVSPIFRRIFYVSTTDADGDGKIDNTLYGMNCFANTCDYSDTSTSNIPYAYNIEDMQLTYDVEDPLNNDEIVTRNIFCNPCKVTSVNITLRVRLNRPNEVDDDGDGQPDNPMTRSYSTTVFIKNMGLGYAINNTTCKSVPDCIEG
jgi:prepilin-type N-terminal cleavage/methylation domain-containing protein